MKKFSLIKYTIIVLNVIVPLVPIVFFIYQKVMQIPEQQDLLPADSIIVLFLEGFLISLGKYHDCKVEKCIFGRSKQEVLKEINPPTKNELEKAREEMREGLKILMIVSVVCLICSFFVGWIKINIAIAIGLCMVIAFIYADYLPHVRRYVMEYDAYFEGNEKADSLRGLARIYYQEYLQCGLRRGAKFYKDMDKEKIYVEAQDNSQEAKDYCACVLCIRSAMTNQTLEIIMWSMLAVTVITISDGLYKVILNPITNGHVQEILFYSIKLSAPVVFMAVSICQLYECYKECELVNRIWKLIKGNDLKEMVEECETVIAHPRGKLCKIRGAFVYSQKYIEKHHDISASPLKYRMKFPDRYIANKVRYVYTYLLVTVIGMLLMLEIENMPVKLWIIYLLVAIVGFFVGLVALLPEINRRRIRKKCEELGGIDLKQMK